MSRTCRYREEDLLLFYYGELEPTIQSDVEEHLAACSACRDHLQQLSCLFDSLPRPELEISAAEINRFAARVAARAGAGRAWRPSLPVWGGALAATAALIVTLSVEPPQPLPWAENGSTQLAELEVLQKLELLRDFELLQDLELLTELDLPVESEGRG
jgi:anti-sigma factor RsiW